MPTPKKTTSEDTVDLSKNLAQLSKIAEWFDDQNEIDIEQGLTKVKEASVLIKESRSRLQDIENEFKEIKKDIEKDLE
jgi:hypothetical protein